MGLFDILKGGPVPIRKVLSKFKHQASLREGRKKIKRAMQTVGTSCFINETGERYIKLTR
jgi:hypothetical protein